ncbi:MAG TPA: hypothetical protein VMW81_02650 [Nitrospinota bacterium]|nr:hypothetical protein [Nitrospinota bacterium]
MIEDKEDLLTKSFIKGFIEQKFIHHFPSLVNYSQDKLFRKIIMYVSDLYIENRSLENTAKRLEIEPRLLRDFLLKADNLNVINYKYLKYKSKKKDSNLELFDKDYSIKKLDNIKLNYEYWRKEETKRIVKLLKKSYSIKDVAKSMNMSFMTIRNMLFAEYKCNNITQLRKKLKIKRPLSQKKIEKLKKVKKLYDKLHTLQKTANALGITRERVRQLLRDGEKYGIFKYEIFREKKFEELLQIYNRDYLVREIKTTISPSKICLRLGITEREYYNLLEYYNIDSKEYRRLARMGKWVEKYTQIVDTLGHHPSTYEMSTRKDWKTVWSKITKYWGNIDNFRKEFGIEKPKHKIHPNTRQAWKNMIERKKEIKRENKRKMLDIIKEDGPIGSKSIMNKFGFKRANVLIYINELLEENLITRIGSNVSTKYIAN